MKHDRSKTAGATTIADPDAGLSEGVLVAGKYRLKSRLGRGGMGEVWRGTHEELNSDVAIKFALLDERADVESMFERFRFESQVSAQLSQHTDHIVKVFDAGRHRGTPYMVMELIDGCSLDAMLCDGPIEPTQVAEVLEQLARALAIAHEEAIWHRDIKAENIMVSERRDGRKHVKLTDFGVAKALEERLDVERPKTTEAGMLVGTPHYMSPEQLSGFPVDGRSDLWSLAIVAYEALTGIMPFDGQTSPVVIGAILTQTHPPLDSALGLPTALDAWLDKALAKAPDDRFSTATELAEAFRAALQTEPRGKRHWALAAGVVALAAAAGIAGIAAWRHESPDETTQVTPETSAVATSVTVDAIEPDPILPAPPSAPSSKPAGSTQPAPVPPQPIALPRSTARPHTFDPSEVQ